jgi:hypothetical protein
MRMTSSIPFLILFIFAIKNGEIFYYNLQNSFQFLSDEADQQKNICFTQKEHIEIADFKL